MPASVTATQHGPGRSSYIPADHHLFVATDTKISKWTQDGVLKIFRAAEGGITAAQQNGQLLAIADGWVVTLHDQRGESNKRWTLRKRQDRVNILRFSRDSAELFYSTCLQHAVARFSVPENRLLGYSCLHPSPPVAFAVSTTLKYIVTASVLPPTVYVQTLDSSAQPVLIRPYASATAVNVVEFHPEREDLFLLGFADGTISLHTVDRILLMQDTATGSDGSLGHLKGTQKSTRHASGSHPAVSEFMGPSSTSNRLKGIVAASFLPGHHKRLVTLTVDGKCRMIDFERGSTILRTWYIRSQCTCLAVWSSPNRQPDSSVARPAKYLSFHEASHIIAIGRVDGCVQLFDAAGIFLEEKQFDRAGRPIVGLDWITENGVASHKLSGLAGTSALQLQWAYASEIPSSTTRVATSQTPSRLSDRRFLAKNVLNRTNFVPQVSMHTQPAHQRVRPRIRSLQLKIPGAWISDSNDYLTAPSQAAGSPSSLKIDHAAGERSGSLVSGASNLIPHKRAADGFMGSHTLELIVDSAAKNVHHPSSAINESGHTSNTAAASSRQSLAPELPISSPAKPSSPVSIYASATSSPVSKVMTGWSPRRKCQQAPTSPASDWVTDDEASPELPMERRTALHSSIRRSRFGVRRGQSSSWARPRGGSPVIPRPANPVFLAGPAATNRTSTMKDDVCTRAFKMTTAPITQASVAPTRATTRMHRDAEIESSSRGAGTLPAGTLVDSRSKVSRAMKPLPAVPSEPIQGPDTLNSTTTASQTCNCDCADILTTELNLLRGEVAALRKTLWVVGADKQVGGRSEVGYNLGLGMKP